MVYASIEHPPVVGGTVKSVDDAEALHGEAACADRDARRRSSRRTCSSRSAAWPSSPTTPGRRFKGRRQLKVDWNDGPHASFESDAFKKRAGRRPSASPAKVVRNLGNVDAEFAKGGKVIEATYYTPMRRTRDGAAGRGGRLPERQGRRSGRRRRIRRPCRKRWRAALGIDKKDVTCHVTLLGGGFGRKSKPDYAAEAAVLSKKLGKPVKVVWTREDDIQFDFYHATAAVYHKAVGRRPRASRRRGCSGRRSSRSRPRSTPSARDPLSFELDLGLTRPAVRRAEHPRRERSGRRARAHRLVPRRQPTTSTCSRRAASPTRWRTPPDAIRSSSCSTCSARARCSI